MKKNILVAGGTGLIGTRVVKLLSQNYTVTVLTRSARNNTDAVKFSEWDPSAGKINLQVIKEADIILNLSGENVAEKRWTAKRKQAILQSRVQSNDLLVKTIAATKSVCSSFISASAIGWYGPDTKDTKRNGFKETAEAYPDFLGNTCKAWEASALQAEKLNIRTVCLRTGIVLAKEGGAMKEFVKPMKAGIAAIIGSGDQTVSWIHIEDLCRMYLHAVENENIRGSYNAVAPNPISNKELTLTLAKQKRGNTFIPVHVPSFVIKIMLGEMSVEVLKSTTVNSDKIKNAGFTFLYPGIQSAVEDLLRD